MNPCPACEEKKEQRENKLMVGLTINNALLIRQVTYDPCLNREMPAGLICRPWTLLQQRLSK
jgi:hypothetical protein